MPASFNKESKDGFKEQETFSISRTTSQETPKEAEVYPPAPYAWYVVGVLSGAYLLSFVDRQILNLLVGPIKKDLNINDTEMSLLMGFSFAIFYSIFGLPLGRLADSWSRRTLVALGIAFWSFMTAGCGLAQKFWHLFLLRMGVGAGEATLSPCAYSLISDYFPKEKRATAISVYCMGMYLGSGLSLILGGVIVGFAAKHSNFILPVVGEIRPWQLIFFVLGLPGIFYAVLLYTIREPVRLGVQRIKDASGQTKIVQASMGEVFQYMQVNWKTFLCHYVGFALLGFSNYGSAAWIPTLFIRRYGWTAAEIGQVYGIIVCIFGTLGILTGGRLTDWMLKKGYRDATMRMGLIVVVAWLPTGMFYPLMSDPWLAVALLIPTVFLTCMPFGISAAAVQEMVPNGMRGQASAIYLFVYTMVGLGLGPTGVALLTDFVFKDNQAIHYSLFIVTTIMHIGAAILLYMGLKPFVNTLDYLKDLTEKNNNENKC
jgi:MFS family permease